MSDTAESLSQSWPDGSAPERPSGRPVDSWCARCGMGREPRALTKVTAETSDGRKIAIQVCASCRDFLTGKRGPRP